jgi:hypothetical protein
MDKRPHDVGPSLAIVRRPSFLWLLALIVALVLPTNARASSADTEAEALFEQAAADEAKLELASALAGYEASYVRSPSSRYAQRASTRAAYLRARSEGAFAPLVRLERLRRDPTSSNDGAAIDALARDLERFPDGLVRVEARMVVAEAYLGRLGRRPEGIAALKRALDEPRIDPLTAKHAARQLVEAQLADKDLTGARSEAHARAALLEPTYVTKIDRLARRPTLRAIAIADIALVILLAAWAAIRAWRAKRLDGAWSSLRRAAPLLVAFAVFVAGAGGALASNYEEGNSRPFFYFGLAVLPVVLVSRIWGALGSSSMRARIGRAALAASSAMATAFLVLSAVDPMYLDGFGL